MGIWSKIHQKREFEKALWEQIHRAAIHDAELRDILETALLYYKLKYDSVPDNDVTMTNSHGPF